MKIRPYSSWHIVQVQSESDYRKWHYVDMSANRAVGFCDCENFHYVCGPEIYKGNLLICKHIDTARKYTEKEMLHRALVMVWNEDHPEDPIPL